MWAALCAKGTISLHAPQNHVVSEEAEEEKEEEEEEEEGDEAEAEDA